MEMTGTGDQVTVQVDHVKSDEDVEANFDGLSYQLPEYMQHWDYKRVFLQPSGYEKNGLGKVMSKPLNKMLMYIFNYTQTATYFILVAMCGMFLAFGYALAFAATTFLITWLALPLMALAFAAYRVTEVTLRSTLRAVLDPIFQSVGQVLSGIRGRMSIALIKSKV